MQKLTLLSVCFHLVCSDLMSVSISELSSCMLVIVFSVGKSANVSSRLYFAFDVAADSGVVARTLCLR